MSHAVSLRPVTPGGTQARLLDAALDLFLRNGYEETTVRAIADGAGFTIGALYGIFGSKRTVLYRVVDGMVQIRSTRKPFPSPAHRALLLTVASFAHTESEAAAVLSRALARIAPGDDSRLDQALAGELLTQLAENRGADGKNG